MKSILPPFKREKMALIRNLKVEELSPEKEGTFPMLMGLIDGKILSFSNH